MRERSTLKRKKGEGRQEEEEESNDAGKAARAVERIRKKYSGVKKEKRDDDDDDDDDDDGDGGDHSGGGNREQINKEQDDDEDEFGGNNLRNIQSPENVDLDASLVGMFNADLLDTVSAIPECTCPEVVASSTGSSGSPSSSSSFSAYNSQSNSGPTPPEFSSPLTEADAARSPLVASAMCLLHGLSKGTSLMPGRRGFPLHGQQSQEVTFGFDDNHETLH
jgi:hypothetical protein